MKKITLTIASLLVASVGFGQVSSALEDGNGNNSPEIFMQQSPNLDPCSQSTPSNAIENGHGNLHLLIVANDFTVEPNETFTVEQLKFTILVTPGLTVEAADLTFYEDSGNGPGAEITSETGIVPSNQAVVGSNFGFDAEENVFDLSTVVELEGGASGAVYWVGIQIQYAGDNSYLEGTSIVDTPNEGYYFDSGTGEFVAISVGFGSDPFDGVFEISGDCSALGVNDNALSQVSIYPNPSSGILNIETPASVEVNSVAVYDVLGKKSNVSLVNGQVNISNLANGVYILSMDTNAGTLTQKIVKN
ncbi:MAG: hypothetical protein CMC07_05825 [Flavobacteriaceae bacterium]|jgi:hypothetical protein|nr:hypothetical protein [Flavobacteriaceae bacterium]|tara:strand:- start:17854 stop:18765 length:912 start_codon:yes stop_codon:yes gene_type:complete